MLIVSDVHGATEALARVAARGEPLLVLGDLVNFVDYRTMDGILADVAGKELVAEMAELRYRGDFHAASRRWKDFAASTEIDFVRRHRELIEATYAEVHAALDGCEAYVTYGNVDRPELLRDALPDSCTFIEAGVVEIEGWQVGIVGGGPGSPLGVPGEVSEEEFARRLEGLGEVDILCTHAAPAVRPLSHDVVAGEGRVKESAAIRAHIERTQPAFHYFGDIHQPQATRWLIGRTLARNVGYFRATERAVRHG